MNRQLDQLDGIVEEITHHFGFFLKNDDAIQLMKVKVTCEQTEEVN